MAHVIKGQFFSGRFFKSEVARFLIAGGSAALINWLARIGFSQLLPLDQAILLAYGIGMLAGFLLYRSFVFESAIGTLSRQITIFLGVNLVGAVVVVAATLALKGLALSILPRMDASFAEALAHGAAIGIGAVSNYFGHRLLTFRPAQALQSR
jgi:energy-coupling factor transport system substrate-specific component